LVGNASHNAVCCAKSIDPIAGNSRNVNKPPFAHSGLLIFASDVMIISRVDTRNNSEIPSKSEIFEFDGSKMDKLRISIKKDNAIVSSEIVSII
jgi:hypothetical protein